MKLRHKLSLTLAALSAQVFSAPLVDVEPLLPNAIFDIRYQSSYNFVGAPLDGYNAPKCLLTEAAADALQAVQQEAQQQGLVLKILDCYRPQRAVDHVVRWARDRDDVKMKHMFYPEVDKADLFDEGYIARQSGHSRGSTVDLTLV